MTKRDIARKIGLLVEACGPERGYELCEQLGGLKGLILMEAVEEERTIRDSAAPLLPAEEDEAAGATLKLSLHFDAERINRQVTAVRQLGDALAALAREEAPTPSPEAQ